MQCENKYHEANLKVLNQIIEEFNVSKDGDQKFYFSRLHQNLDDAGN